MGVTIYKDYFYCTVICVGFKGLGMKKIDSESERHLLQYRR